MQDVHLNEKVRNEAKLAHHTHCKGRATHAIDVLPHPRVDDTAVYEQGNGTVSVEEVECFRPCVQLALLQQL